MKRLLTITGIFWLTKTHYKRASLKDLIFWDTGSCERGARASFPAA